MSRCVNTHDGQADTVRVWYCDWRARETLEELVVSRCVNTHDRQADTVGMSYCDWRARETLD